MNVIMKTRAHNSRQHTHTHSRAYTQSYTYTYIHTCTHTYTHTHTQCVITPCVATIALELGRILNVNPFEIFIFLNKLFTFIRPPFASTGYWIGLPSFSPTFLTYSECTFQDEFIYLLIHLLFFKQNIDQQLTLRRSIYNLRFVTQFQRNILP